MARTTAPPTRRSATTTSPSSRSSCALARERGFAVVFFDQPLNEHVARARVGRGRAELPAARDGPRRASTASPYLDVAQRVDLADADFLDVYHLVDAGAGSSGSPSSRASSPDGVRVAAQGDVGGALSVDGGRRRDAGRRARGGRRAVLTRRQFLIGGGVALGGLAVAGVVAQRTLPLRSYWYQLDRGSADRRGRCRRIWRSRRTARSARRCWGPTSSTGAGRRPSACRSGVTVPRRATACRGAARIRTGCSTRPSTSPTSPP